MAIPLFLAMTGAEFQFCEALPEHIAWMACHFSPYGTGLSNLPPALPVGSFLILNDRIPICRHNPEVIGKQLQQIVETYSCSGVVLDFQRKGIPETAQLAAHLVKAIPCPVAVSDHYAQMLDCPAFLSPCPHHTPLSEYILPWKGRKLWLDLAVNAESITLTKTGSQILPLPLGEFPEGGHTDSLLHCHYSVETREDSARFILWRTPEDMEALSGDAEKLGIENILSLFCETRQQCKSRSGIIQSGC